MTAKLDERLESRVVACWVASIHIQSEIIDMQWQGGKQSLDHMIFQSKVPG